MARKLVKKTRDYIYVACPRCGDTVRVLISVSRGKPQKKG